VPCVSLGGDDADARAALRPVLDAHRGPLILRAPATGDVPLAPGYLSLTLPALREAERAGAWRDVLAARGLDSAQAAELAARFSVGPGAMVRACVGDPRGIARRLCQHRSARIEAIASRVERLPAWDDLVLPDDVCAALHEVCDRVRHRATVLERWGLGGSAPAGVTALFQGGPGTGKTMTAGVIARALGFELWRVDLSRIVSKWLGETEKNLARAFEAAEEGGIVLLFDEADSLFGKRTEAKSSNDRNANLEVNYLLQRLDTFTGVAILTTNFGTAIDPAFRRRLAVHVQFSFPDADDRERLWRAHLPPSLPQSGSLDLAALAVRHAMSGGHIRNAALRAAFLAARAGEHLTHDLLERAIALEYERSGKLGDGRLE
jgi:hypothetical protein